MMLRFLTLGTVVVTLVTGHASMTKPIPRNAADRVLPEYADGKWVPVAGARNGNSGCSCTGSSGGCDAGINRNQTNGQPCLWFSQGCSPGCKTCTGENGHTTQPLCDNWMPPTNNDTRTRTEDPTDPTSYLYTPWRAPGFAPVADACGLAGGTLPAHAGGGVAVFYPTPFAKQGDKGSEVLKKGLAMETWVAGTSVEVAFGIRYNHGGGYQYRLCPAAENLTEACFQQMPLEFDVTKQQLQWNNGTRLSIPGTWVNKGTSPPGSVWAMNPIPRIDWGGGGGSKDSGGCRGTRRGKNCVNFKPPCTEGVWDGGVPWHAIDSTAPGDDVEGYCSGDWTGGQIVDEVLIPKDIPKGDYVVGWRWDCEETTQVWSSCGDVTIV